MYLGLGLRLGGLGLSGFDADAAAYFDRAGVTDATAKAQINAFVKGVKNLSLWSSMVCWPLRSAQNKGSGTTAYSLGGLGIYNGTLVNGPTWGTSGIAFDGINDYIDSGFNPVSASLSNTNSLLGTVALSNPTGAYSQLIGNELAGNFRSATGFSRDNAGNLYYFNASDGAGVVTDSAIGMCISETNSTLVKFIRNGSIAQSYTAARTSFTNVNYFIGAGNSNNLVFYNASTTIAFALVISRALTVGEHSSFYSLYKTTLGTGLGLP